MKKLLKIFWLIIFFKFLLINSVFADSLLPLKKYLERNIEQKEDPSVYMYVSDRCSAAYMFMAVIVKNKEPDFSKQVEDASTKFKMFAFNILTKKFGRNEADALKLIKDNSESTLKLYLKDGKENYTRTGSYFLGSYIEEDLQICKGFESVLQ